MDEILARARLWLICERGKAALGEGNNSIGDLVPGLFAGWSAVVRGLSPLWQKRGTTTENFNKAQSALAKASTFAVINVYCIIILSILDEFPYLKRNSRHCDIKVATKIIFIGASGKP